MQGQKKPMILVAREGKMSSSSATISSSSNPALPGATPGVSAEVIQRLIDQAAGFNLYVVPEGGGQPAGSGTSGFVLTERLHRFDVTLQPPSSRSVQAANSLGEVVGQLEIRWFMIPDNFVARPDRQSATVQLDPGISQRFVMQETTFRFGNGEDGFRSFGTGRTFPMKVGNQPRIVVGAVGNLIEGFGKFRGHEGNFTVCGDLQSDGFKGNILVRIQDSAGNLRTSSSVPALQPQSDPDPQTTYLLWAAQKGKGADQENFVSLGPDGQIRGMNIPTQLKLVHLDFAAQNDFQGKDFGIGAVVGREIGFGRGSIPGASPSGTALSPFLFEGVARYSFFSPAGKTVGAITTNVLEGRRFDMKLPAAPSEPALRFGFFGPILYGTGCFAGVEGMFYGSTGSVFNPPPGDHIITHFYMARLHDPEGKFRAAISGGGGGEGWL
jgi:hypothetical protein